MNLDQELQHQKLLALEPPDPQPQDKEPAHQKPRDLELQELEPPDLESQDKEPQHQKLQDLEPLHLEPQYQKPQYQDPQYQQPQNTSMQVIAISSQPTPAPEPAHNVTMVVPSRVGPKPSMVNCSVCQRSVLTNVKHVSTGKTHCAACCLFLFCCPCFFLPYVTKCCRRADHSCPGCNAFIGSHPE